MDAKNKMVYVLGALFLLITASCDSPESIIPYNPIGIVVDYAGCKTFNGEGSANVLANLNHDQSQDCIEYNYNGNGILQIQHVNAGFNCCPGKIVANIQIENNSIVIKEQETEALCLCLCLFDVNYKIENLKPGKYQLKIKELYTNEQDTELELMLDLSQATSGAFCVPRDHYPWK